VKGGDEMEAIAEAVNVHVLVGWGLIIITTLCLAGFLCVLEIIRRFLFRAWDRFEYWYWQHHCCWCGRKLGEIRFGTDDARFCTPECSSVSRFVNR
jgi:hypothetical protein